MTVTTDIQAYAVGICQASVCAPADAAMADVEAALNHSHPTGLDHGWKKSDDPTFRGGERNPCQCNTDPDRLHWLLVC